MTKTEIIDKVNAFLVDEYEKEPDLLKPTARIREDLDLNSLDYMDLIVTTNRTFGLRLVPAQLNMVVTLEDLYDFIERELNNKSAKEA